MTRTPPGVKHKLPTIEKYNTRRTANTKSKNGEEIYVLPPRKEGEKSSEQTVIRETPEYERVPCMTHESTIEAIIEIAREVINTFGTTAKTSKQQAVLKLRDMITHLEEPQVETEVMEEQMRDRTDERTDRREKMMSQTRRKHGTSRSNEHYKRRTTYAQT
jgi:hypothetical protein